MRTASFESQPSTNVEQQSLYVFSERQGERFLGREHLPNGQLALPAPHHTPDEMGRPHIRIIQSIYQRADADGQMVRL